jgi:type I restriction enzyme S subunit
VAKVIAGQSAEGASVNDSGDGLPFLQGCAEFGPKQPHADRYCSEPPKVAPAQSWLLSVRAPVGRLNRADQAYGIGRGLAAILATGIDDRYLGYALEQRATALASLATGSTFQAVSAPQIGSLDVPLPPFDTQARIAAFLDEKTAQIDGLIARKQALLERLAEKRQAIITQAVTKGLNPTAPMKDSGIDWLGQIPAHWEVKRLKHLVHPGIGLQMGPFGGMLTELSPEPTGFKLYGQENTISGNFALGHRWIDEDRFHDLARYQLNAGDLVITRKGSLGSCRRFPADALPGLADSDTIIIRFDEAKLQSELAIILLHDAAYIAAQIESTRRGAILAGLNSTVVGDLWIVCPPAGEQKTISDWCCAYMSKTDRLIAAVEASIAQATEYRAALITAAVTGQIEGLQ